MPSFSKKALSLYLRNGCERQFVLSLYTNSERKIRNMPPNQQLRAAPGYAAQAGYAWQDEKVTELKDVFGEENVYVNPVSNGKRPAKTDLLTVLPKVQPHQFIVEAAYNADTSTFRKAMQLDALTDIYGDSVDISSLQPDIIQILPQQYAASDPKTGGLIDSYELGIQPNGETFALEPNDSRLRLRVIDIKLTTEPGAHYFAEVVYYAMTLAAWLIEQNLSDKFVVIGAPAVWPGSHDASELSKQMALWKRKAYQPTAADMAAVVEKEIEIAPIDVFAPRLRRFLCEELPLMLKRSWQDLAWHVDYHCKGCEFLGYPWMKDGVVANNPLHCWPTAESLEHLSRVVGLSRGASEHLRGGNVRDVPTLAATNFASTIFDEHQTLRAKRTTFPYRAIALKNNATSVIPHSGGDALMPRWPDLHIYIFIDYDLSSAITASIVMRAWWLEPLPVGSSLQRHTNQWNQKKGEDEVFLIDERNLPRERKEFLQFLRQLRKILSEVNKWDARDFQDGRRDSKTEHSTYQIYLWDESQRKHLIRLIGRHLSYILIDPQLNNLAWLFPPPELLQYAEDATRMSPITLVSNVVANTVAVPIPHYYRLLDIAQSYRRVGSSAPSIHPLYEEPMSDLIPAERIHEWWNRDPHWLERQEFIAEATQKKALALSLIVSRLEDDLGSSLARQAAPRLARLPRQMSGVAPQSSLWLEYERLNAAIDELEVHTIRSMPPHEREARLKSARLTKRVSGVEEQNALVALSDIVGIPLLSSSDLYIYKMRDASREVNIKPGEFLFALAPEGHYGFLDEHPYPYIKGTSFEKKIFGNTIAEVGMTAVSVVAIDRANGYIALRAAESCYIPQLEQETTLRFSHNVVLDPVHKDFLTRKIKLTIQGIGYPPSAAQDQRTMEALGLSADPLAKKSPPTPAAEILWQASTVCDQFTGRKLDEVYEKLRYHFEHGTAKLDSSQRNAWFESLSRRLSLIWGPPGTGKSYTLRAIVLGAVLDATMRKRSLRLLISANTYTAIDNVLLKLDEDLKILLPDRPYDIVRIQSKWQPQQSAQGAQDTGVLNLILNRAKPTSDIKKLRKRLDKATEILIVGCLPQQIHNLAVAKATPTPQDTIRTWFDLVIIDEATQMDVATSTLIFTKLAANGSCVLAGDDLQLPPIQPAEPPTDLEDVVGSIYNYFRRTQNITPHSLDVNYRSNRTLVEFTKTAGYSSKLTSFSPDLKLNLLPIPSQKPAEWPNELYWSTEWSKFLDPNHPVVCFVYEDTISSQINDFEADAVSSLVWLLNGRLADRLLNMREPNGSIPNPSKNMYTSSSFWHKALGVVTPHRAQMSRIVYRLQQIFPTDSKEEIRGAVDTVERFQGQERDVIIGSFGLGDPDIISAEDEFLYNLNRFNVLASRACAKLIVFVTRSLLDHLSNDVDVLRESHLLKHFAESYCIDPRPIQLGFVKNQVVTYRSGVLRRR